MQVLSYSNYSLLFYLYLGLNLQLPNDFTQKHFLTKPLIHGTVCPAPILSRLLVGLTQPFWPCSFPLHLSEFTIYYLVKQPRLSHPWVTAPMSVFGPKCSSVTFNSYVVLYFLPEQTSVPGSAKWGSLKSLYCISFLIWATVLLH